MDTIELVAQAAWNLKWWLLAIAVVLGVFIRYDQPYTPQENDR